MLTFLEVQGHCHDHHVDICHYMSLVIDLDTLIVESTMQTKIAKFSGARNL